MLQPVAWDRWPQVTIFVKPRAVALFCLMRGFTTSICLRSCNALRFSSTATGLFILLASLGCGVSSPGAPRPTAPPTSTGTVPHFGHVVLVVEENSSYSEVIGSSEMPYLNSLATQYG